MRLGPVPVDERPLLRVFSCSREAIEILKRTRPSLIHWVGPAFPEDLCFYFENGDVCIETVAHEGGAGIYVPKGNHELHVQLQPFVTKGLLSLVLPSHRDQGRQGRDIRRQGP